jgi:Zn-dependent protease with chaperone function
MLLIGLVMGLFFFRLILKRRFMRFLYHGAFLIFLIGIAILFPFRAVWSSQPPPEIGQELSREHQLLAKSFGLQRLDISIRSSQFPMAHVTSFSGDSASILVSSGLNDMLEPDEMGFVIAHELTHHKLKHYPIRMLLAVGVLLFYFLITWLIMRRKDSSNGPDSSGQDEIGFFLRRIPLYFLVGLVISLAPLGQCRVQETKADLYAIKVTGNAEAGRSALEKLAQAVPSRRHDPFEFFSLHPCLEKRIKRLR